VFATYHLTPFGKALGHRDFEELIAVAKRNGSRLIKNDFAAKVRMAVRTGLSSDSEFRVTN
jgi:hypothetical protein